MFLLTNSNEPKSRAIICFVNHKFLFYKTFYVQIITNCVKMCNAISNYYEIWRDFTILSVLRSVKSSFTKAIKWHRLWVIFHLWTRNLIKHTQNKMFSVQSAILPIGILDSAICELILEETRRKKDNMSKNLKDVKLSSDKKKKWCRY